MILRNSVIPSALLALGLSLGLGLSPARAQLTDTPVSVVVCVPDSTLTASVSPCPSVPIALPQVVTAVLLSPTDYANLLAYDGPIDQSAGSNLVLTVAGFVLGAYVLSLGIGSVLNLIRKAS